MPRVSANTRFLRCLPLSVALGLATCVGLAQPGAPEWKDAIQTEECLAVTGPRILASELAAQDARFVGLAPDTDLGYAPDPGAVRWIKRPGATHQTTCVVRHKKPIPAEQMMEALDLNGLGNVEAGLLSWTQEPLPSGHLHMPRSGIVSPARGTREVLWRGALEYDRDASGKVRSLPVWARVRLSRQQPCLRLLRPQRRGQPLDLGATETAPCDAAAIVAAALSPGDAKAPGDAKGDWLIARDLPAGAWLLVSHRTHAPVLQRGERATLAVTSGGVSLALPVITEQAGGMGQIIWVRSVADRKRIQATITGPQRLEVRTGDAPAARNTQRSSRPIGNTGSPRAHTNTARQPAAAQRMPF